MQILAERNMALDLTAAIAVAADLQPTTVDKATRQEVLGFIGRRLEQWLLDQGFRTDLVQAVLAARAGNPDRALTTVRDLAALVDTEQFATMLKAYARPARIIRGQQVAVQVDPTLFEHDVEHALWQGTREIAQTLRPDLSPSRFPGNFQPLVDIIDAFFGTVFVMAEDSRVRANRLALLK